MKKTVSLILALTLALALSVPAFAADYGKVTVEQPYNTVTFNEAKQEYKTVKLVEWSDEINDLGEVTYENALVVTVKPGSTADGEGNYNPCFVNSNGAVERNEAVGAMLGYGTGIDGEFGDHDMGGFNAQYVMLMGTWGTESDMKTYFVVRDGDSIPAGTISGGGDASTTPAQTTTPTTSTNEPTPTTTTPAGSGSYTAQKYDTYGKLAVNYYGSYAYTKSLQKANNYKTLKAGVAVTLPDTLGNAVRLAPATAGAGEKLYTVLAGDTLGTIAKAYYGNSARYKAIFERNADRLKNANTIYEGQVIVLPAK